MPIRAPILLPHRTIRAVRCPEVPASTTASRCRPSSQVIHRACAVEQRTQAGRHEIRDEPRRHDADVHGAVPRLAEQPGRRVVRGEHHRGPDQGRSGRRTRPAPGETAREGAPPSSTLVEPWNSTGAEDVASRDSGCITVRRAKRHAEQHRTERGPDQQDVQPLGQAVHVALPARTHVG